MPAGVPATTAAVAAELTGRRRRCRAVKLFAPGAVDAPAAGSHRRAETRERNDMPSSPSEHHPAQEQARQPGRTAPMQPKPRAEMRGWRGAGKLDGKAALITGGDSGIGRAVAIGFAKEGADVAIVYLEEHEDAEATKGHIEEQGRRCLTIAGDVGDEAFCQAAVERVLETFGRLDLLVNNAAEQHPRTGSRTSAPASSSGPSRPTSSAMFHLTKAALAHLPEARRSSTRPRSPPTAAVPI